MAPDEIFSRNGTCGQRRPSSRPRTAPNPDGRRRDIIDDGRSRWIAVPSVPPRRRLLPRVPERERRCSVGQGRGSAGRRGQPFLRPPPLARPVEAGSRSPRSGNGLHGAPAMVTAGLRPCLRVGLLLVLGCAHIAAAAAEEHEADALVRESRAASHFKGLYDFLQQRDATVFCKYLRRAEVEDVLVSLQAFTIFAPNDMAFAALPASLLKKIESDKRFLRTFVLHHIAGDAVSSRSLKGELEITTLSGDNLLVKVYDNGRTISIAGGNILQGDTNFENVVLHIVDRVLYPFAESVLPQTIQSKYGYFYKLLQSAGLVQVLNSDLYTVFIPTQDAINSLPADTSKAILSDSTLLKRVLSHHIVPGLQFSGVFKDGATLTPLDGEVMRVTTQAGQIFIDGVPFVNYDEGATNGVIHLVNRVLMPKSVIEDCGCFASKDDVSLIGQKLTIQGPTLVGQQLPGITQQHVLLPGTVSTVSGLTTRVISPGGVVSLQQPFGIFSTGKVPLPGAPGFLGATPLVSGKPGLPAFGGRKPSPPTAPQASWFPDELEVLHPFRRRLKDSRLGCENQLINHQALAMLHTFPVKTSLDQEGNLVGQEVLVVHGDQADHSDQAAQVDLGDQVLQELPEPHVFQSAQGDQVLWACHVSLGVLALQEDQPLLDSHDSLVDQGDLLDQVVLADQEDQVDPAAPVVHVDQVGQVPQGQVDREDQVDQGDLALQADLSDLVDRADLEDQVDQVDQARLAPRVLHSAESL
ncbi:hypothetical protein HPB47_022773 [Ixodes persulcatus]|uniref:Uncharacterized protein n=1 Tax=Ixodes persulcatus TaxID=34615 RepID=A0AC60QB47_IXOPE|nr:hypothetical protein HPB47_022773 [Ixodes persulcatus]